jgi:phosphate acyltransferase
MSEKLLPIAVDAMGGDYAPEVVIDGAAESGVPVILVGPEKIIAPMAARSPAHAKTEIVNAEQVIGMDEHAFSAVRNKKESSMMVAIKLVRDGKAGGVMSAGNTGAFMAGATMILGRLPEVSRPAAAIPIPTPSGQSLLLDAGAATDSTVSDLVNFAVMGATYASLIWKFNNPRVGLLSIGEEESKGSKQARETHARLKSGKLNFIGNVQGSDIGSTVADVIVTDGFTGNVALKSAEGFAGLVMEVVKDELKAAKGVEKLAAWVLYPLFRRIKKRLDWQEYGGGSLLGVKGNVVIAHGKSGKRAIASAIRLTSELSKTDLLMGLESALSEYHKLDVNYQTDTEGKIQPENQ